MMMAPSTKENSVAKGLSVKDFAEFLGDEAEHNLLIFGDNESRRHTRNLALTLGVDLDPAEFYLRDNS